MNFLPPARNTPDASPHPLEAVLSTPVLGKIPSPWSSPVSPPGDAGAASAAVRERANRKALRDAAVQAVLLDGALTHYRGAMRQLDEGPAGLGCGFHAGPDPVWNLRQAAALLHAAADVLADRQLDLVLPDPELDGEPLTD